MGTKDGTLEFKGNIQNVGFGNIVNKKNVSVILNAKEGSGTYTALTDIDARNWRPALDSRASNTSAYRDLSFSVNKENVRRACKKNKIRSLLKAMSGFYA